MKSERRNRGAIGQAVTDTAPVSLNQLMTARKKPKNTSDARWRMELARRRDPVRFALAGVAVR